MARRPRLAPAFTVAVEASTLWLIAGEDVRYRLGVADPAWLRDLLVRCDGRTTVDELLASVPVAHRDDARTTLERLASERVLVDGTAAEVHVAAPVAY
nr:hypothetical protein [Myxococcota bacterium]